MRGLSRRGFLGGSAAIAGAAGLGLPRTALASDAIEGTELAPLTGDAKPISVAERQARLEKAAGLLRESKAAAVLIEAGSALEYFTGIQWWRSERLTAAVLTRDGTLSIVTPFFEAPSIDEQLALNAEIVTWHEDESPFERVADLVDAAKGPLLLEETVRYFIASGIAAAAPRLKIADGRAVTRGCRMFKSPAELALMQVASDVTMAAYRYVHPQVVPGMTPRDITRMMNAATAALGGRVSFSIALAGPASAYPHGTRQPQRVEEGGIVLMDCGCSVHGYQSDISRTWVVGEANAGQRRVWETAKRGQEIALETIEPGIPAGEVDVAVRTFYEREGFGPGYQAPGLTHRLGHGIGMDGHEPINFVRGETTPLATGMCFSNEPGIYLPGQFGVRLEDCLHITESGARLFSGLSPSLASPLG
ncbi:MAG: Xaa-Pro peptidase family protein [Pseudomonadota bacterium]